MRCAVPASAAEAENWEVEIAHAALLAGELGDDLTDFTLAYRRFGLVRCRRGGAAAAGLRSRGLTVPRRAAQPDRFLTDTEVQLVRLVREGLSNRQIATAMHYSPKTIEVYSSRVYAKTGCGSRLELIRFIDTGAVTLADDGPTVPAPAPTAPPSDSADPTSVLDEVDRGGPRRACRRSRWRRSVAGLSGPQHDGSGARIVQGWGDQNWTTL